MPHSQSVWEKLMNSEFICFIYMSLYKYEFIYEFHIWIHSLYEFIYEINTLFMYMNSYEFKSLDSEFINEFIA